jgi:glucose-6-phosphate isomerase
MMTFEKMMRLGGAVETVKDQLRNLRQNRVVERIWQKDHTVWHENPSEIANRLGWLDCPKKVPAAIEQVTPFTDQVRADGFRTAVLLGMGGSSLAPEVYRRVFGVAPGYLDLRVIDTTDPDTIRDQQDGLDLQRTLFVVATKSGGTVETISLMKYFFNQTTQQTGPERAGRCFTAITDGGSRLEDMARQLNFRKIFFNDPHIGGRYSALSFFGLVPAALIGMDMGRVAARSMAMAVEAGPQNCPVSGDNQAVWLGAALGQMALIGRDKLSLLLSEPLEPFGPWVEQLIAESTGKQGKGILPVIGETFVSVEQYADDRLFVCLGLNGDTALSRAARILTDAGHPVIDYRISDLYDISGEFFRWEMATAVAGAIMAINPFDQPNVESAKVKAREMVQAFQQDGRLPSTKPTVSERNIDIFAEGDADSAKTILEDLLTDTVTGQSYVALQAYTNPTPKVHQALKHLRDTIRDRFRVAVTIGYGPRFLHSTGQLHKGDGGRGVFLQLINTYQADIGIPDQAGRSEAVMTFGILIHAQALGDRQALQAAGRKIITCQPRTQFLEMIAYIIDLIAAD